MNSHGIIDNKQLAYGKLVAFGKAPKKKKKAAPKKAKA
jgi:hypothetical protein